MSGWTTLPQLEVIPADVADAARVLWLNYPNNPTGAVLPYDEIAALAKIAVERDLIVISDEVYERMVYDDAKHYCIAAFPGMRERTLCGPPWPRPVPRGIALPAGIPVRSIGSAARD